MNAKVYSFLFLILVFCLISSGVQAQVCATPGKDGVNKYRENTYYRYCINTYFSPAGEMELVRGDNQIQLEKIRDDYNYEWVSIEPGDLLLIIQIQDAIIHASNDTLYGANNPNSGPDQKGGSGYTDLGNTGKYEYVVAANNVPRGGGVLKFIGLGPGKGTVNSYVNALPTSSRGARVFQVIRIPQYSNFIGKRNSYTAMPFNGKVGGVAAIQVTQTLDLENGLFESAGKGFRGGYSDDDDRATSAYVLRSGGKFSLGKGEGVAGTPRKTHSNYDDSYDDPADQGFEELPMGDYGRGAPGNAGGGGAGGGGGGNGGAGGRGGNGLKQLAPANETEATGGRPGAAVYDAGSPDFTRLIMGGGGGAGDDQYKSLFMDSWSSYGPGGGIILINVGKLNGNGYLYAMGGSTHGEGGGAGGTVFLNMMQSATPQSPFSLKIIATGGSGVFNDEYVSFYTPGLGGGGGGGQVFHNLPPGVVTIDVKGGAPGKPMQNEIRLLGEAGQDGNVVPFTTTDLPPYLRMGTCFPELHTTMRHDNSGLKKYPGDEVTYTIKTTNAPATANAAGVRLEVQLPSGFIFQSATAICTGYSAGPATLSNLSKDPNRPLLGDFIFFSGDEITLTLKAKVGCGTLAGTYHSSVQALYLDPTRTTLDSNRRISPVLYALQGTKTSYESGPYGDVGGSNYDGNLATSTAEDVEVSAVSIQNNVITAQGNTVRCISGDPDEITGTALAETGDGFSYQWQQSVDQLNFTDIPGATSRDFDPPPITVSTSYRRMVLYLGCVSAVSPGNAVLFKVLKPLPKVDFELPAICVKDGMAIFKNTTTIADGAEQTLTYLWDFGDAENATADNPNQSSDKEGAHRYSRAGHYTVTLTAYKEGNCPTVLLKEFTVNGGIPTAGFAIRNTKFCSGETLVFEDQASVDFGEITRVEWYFDAENDPSLMETDDHPQERGLTPGRLYQHAYPVFRSPAVKTVKVRMVVYSGKSCVDERTKTIQLNAVPELNFDSIPPVCVDAAPLRLSQGKEIWGVVSGSGKYSGPGITEEGLFDPAKAGEGSHTLRYSFESDNGCAAPSKTQTVTVLPLPLAKAGADQVILEGGQVRLGAGEAEPGLTYKWSPATGLDRDDVLNPMASPLRDITYKLRVRTAGGCVAEDEVTLQVWRNPEIPNSFSPNGDGLNDEWNIRYLGSYPLATIKVYNRYGDVVFTATGNVKSWNGKHQGKDVPVGTYYYVIDPRNGRKVITGSLTVLR